MWCGHVMVKARWPFELVIKWWGQRQEKDTISCTCVVFQAVVGNGRSRGRWFHVTASTRQFVVFSLSWVILTSDSSLADLRGRQQFTPLNSISFIFMQFWGEKFDQIIGWHPDILGLAPRLGNPGSATIALFTPAISTVIYSYFGVQFRISYHENRHFCARCD